MDEILDKLLEAIFANVFEGEDLPAQMIRQAIKDGSLEPGHFIAPWKGKVNGLFQRVRGD